MMEPIQWTVELETIQYMEAMLPIRCMAGWGTIVWQAMLTKTIFMAMMATTVSMVDPAMMH